MPRRTSFGLRDRMKLNPRSEFYARQRDEAHNTRIKEVFDKPEQGFGWEWDFESTCELYYRLRDIIPCDEKRTT